MIPLADVRAMLADWTERAEINCDDPSGVEFDLARDVLTLAAALETAERERDTLRANRGTVDRILSAWASIAHAHRVDPSPANAERLATLATFAAQLRDEAIAERDTARSAHAELAAAVRAERDMWLAQIETTTNDAAAALDMVDDLVLHAVLHHPLPWRVERDWTHEVTAKDGTIVAKCMNHNRAAAIVAAAEKIVADLNTDAIAAPTGGRE